MSSTSRTLVAILSVVLLAPLSFCVALPIAINEVKAVNWGLDYGRMPHPPDTARILVRQGIDKVSNGDNCDFFVFEARSYTPGDEASIEAFYARQDNPIYPQSNSVRPRFFARGGSPPPSFEPYDTFYREVGHLRGGPYYTLEAWAVVESAPPLIDWRCP